MYPPFLPRVKDQGETKDEPRNDQGTLNQEMCCLLRLTKTLDLIPKTVDCFPEKVDSSVSKKNRSKSDFSCSIQNNSLPLQSQYIQQIRIL